MSDLHYLSAVEALAMFGSKELSPVELLTAVIARAQAVEPRINAFAETRFDEAMNAAKAAEARYGRGEPAGPLDGLPVAVKEEAPIAGQRNTLGSLPLRDIVATKTAAFVQRILDAGAIVHARTTTPQNADGILIDPPMSEPVAKVAVPAARAAADPPLDPPGEKSVFQGFRVAPGVMNASSVVTVLPMTIAPASSSATTAAADRSGTRPR